MSTRAADAKSLVEHVLAFVRAHNLGPFAVVVVVADPADLATIHAGGTGADADHIRMAGEAVERFAKKIQRPRDSFS